MIKWHFEFELICSKDGKTAAKPPAVSRYFSKFLFDLGKIDLPRIIHAKFQIKIRRNFSSRDDFSWEGGGTRSVQRFARSLGTDKQTNRHPVTLL